MSDFYNAEYLSERLAAVCKERDELRRICEKQAEANGRMAAMALELDTVKALIKEGADINASAKDNTTPLHSHIKRGNYNIVRHLIEQQDIKLNPKDNEGHTPTFYCKDLNFKRVLEDKGAKEE